jgi:hypothetical protein
MHWNQDSYRRIYFAPETEAHGSGGSANLLPNGSFEEDSDGDGVADGWIAQDFNFSRQKREEVQAFIDNLPSYEVLLAGDRIVAADGTVLYERETDGSWGQHVLETDGSWGPHVAGTEMFWGDDEKSWKLEENWYARLRDDYLWRQSRFGVPPVPEGLDLGDATLVLSSRRPQEPVVSEPLEVEPDTGYRLSFWVKTSGGGEYWWGPQVLDGSVDFDSVPSTPGPGDHRDNPYIINSIPASNWWGGGGEGRFWTRMELPFRTGLHCHSIVIRLPYPHRDEAERSRMYNQDYRVWYDDLRLVEDPSVCGQGPTEEECGGRSEPLWPSDVVERGFAAAPRPSFPATCGGYIPTLEETREPIRLSLCAGETDSAVIFIRAIGKPVAVRAAPTALVSPHGYGIANDYGARFITLRASEMAERFLTSKRYARVPKYLLNQSDLEIPAGSSGQFWLTATVPPGTPPGEYVGEVKITRAKPSGDEQCESELNVPVVLTVRDIDLEESDVAFFTWYHTGPVPSTGKLGPAHALPGSDEIYLADQRRHGMNTVAIHCKAERKDSAGGFHVTFNELDAMVANVRRAELCLTQPLILHTWRDDGEGGEFCEFAGGKNTVISIVQHARRSGWPDLLFGVLDEPANQNRSTRVAEVISTQYAEPRKLGVRTVSASGRSGVFIRPLTSEGHTAGDLFDVWVEAMYGSRWTEMQEAAARKNAELWMYNCWITGAGYLQERFYAGLWTWRTGAKGNGVWSYGWYVRITDSGLPEAKTAWEGRLAGVNDYRYLRTLESTIAAADAAGRSGESVRQANEFLADLRRRIPYTTYSQRPGSIPQNQWAELDAWNPAPNVQPPEYARIRDNCTEHIIAIRRECELSKGERAVRAPSS